RLSTSRSPLRADVAGEVSRAMQQAARPVTFSLLIILLVYLPLMALEGVEGRMFRPMAITVALALGGALAFSLTAFPALAAFTLTAPKGAHDEAKGVFARARAWYARAVAVLLRHPVRTLGAALLSLGAAVLLGLSLGAE